MVVASGVLDGEESAALRPVLELGARAGELGRVGGECGGVLLILRWSGVHYSALDVSQDFG